MKYDIFTIGGATEDLAFHTNEGVVIDNKKDVLRQKLVAFEYGAKVKVDKATSSFGGGATNAAVALSRLGFKTACLVAVGDDERGSRIIKNLKKEKVNVKFVQVIKGETSGLSPMVICQDNEHVSFSIRGANSRLRISDKDVKQFKKAEYLYLASLSGSKKEWLENLDKIFSTKKAKIAWNPGHLQLLEGKAELKKYLVSTYALIVNIDEARELVISDPQYKGKPPKFFNDTKGLLKIIKSWGPQIIIITLAEKGAKAYDGEKFYDLTPSTVKKQLNTVGVGDAFGSSFIAGLKLYRGDIDKALALGRKNAASVIRYEGAQIGLIHKKEI